MAKTRNQTYKEINYDRLAIWVKKGARDEYKAGATELGISLAALVQRGVEEYISNHAGAEFVPTTPAETLTAEEKRTLERLNSLPKSTRAKFTALLAEVAALVDEKGGDSNGNNNNIN